MFTRLFGNKNQTCKHNGTLKDNGCGKFNDIDAATLRRIKKLGCTHVWFTGVIRHATCTDYSEYQIPTQHPAVVKGNAGSPYAICDYYDVDPDLATDVNSRMAEWEGLIARTHKQGMKVVMDFVPNHVARQYHSICCPEGVRDLGQDDRTDWHFSTKNNFYYCWGEKFLPWFDIKGSAEEPYTECPAKATGNDVFSSQPGKNDWYETVKLNYGIDYCDAGGRSEHFGNPDDIDSLPDTWLKMTEILLYWASKGVDAFRCDMAEMVPSAFWAYATQKVKDVYPWIDFIGEVYDPNQYRTYIASGFDYLYDKVGMYDTVRAVACGQAWASQITSEWQKTDDIRQHMLYFLENHDEQRIASDFFAGDAQRGVPALIVSALLQQNPFMLYAGEEFGERGMDEEGFSGKDGRTTIFDYWCVDTIRRGYYDRRKLTKEEKALEAMHSKVLNIATSERAVSEGQFYDLMYVNPLSADFNPQYQYAFLRSTGEETLLVVANFSGEAADIKVNIPQHAFDFLNVREGEYVANELLSGKEVNIALSATEAVPVSVPALSGIVIKIK